jgi:hypothetical protein
MPLHFRFAGDQGGDCHHVLAFQVRRCRDTPSCMQGSGLVQCLPRFACPDGTDVDVEPPAGNGECAGAAGLLELAVHPRHIGKEQISAADEAVRPRALETARVNPIGSLVTRRH